MFYKFTEHNEWEGETWNFYIPVTSQNLATLKQIMETLPEELADTYECNLLKTYDEDEVDELCETESGTDYLPEHNKVASVKPFSSDDWVDSNDPLYKGGLFDCE